MKISKLFHWLYFFVMALPVLSIPIFAIYSHRHTIDNYTVTRSEQYSFNASQYVFNGLPSDIDVQNQSVDGWQFENNFYITNDNDYLRIDTSFNLCSFNIYLDDEFSNNVNDKYYFAYTSYVVHTYDFSYLSCSLLTGSDDGVSIPVQINGSSTRSSFICTNSYTESFSYIYFEYETTEDTYFYIKDVMVFNLTSIFGSGNEPSASEFDNILVNSYYPYGVNELYGYHDVTYDDTDIGSQFLYVSYNYVDKYFNYDNVFNFGSLYTWLNITFFNGSASLGFFIFWHLLIYWLLTSLLWLLFDVLMYVPLLLHRWLDKASIS